MKKFMRTIVCLLLVSLFVAAVPMEAFAAAKTVKIYRVTADYLRLRSQPRQGDNILTKLRKGSKVFFLAEGTGSARGWYRVRSDHGMVGYVYKDYLSYYGATTTSRVYQATGSAKVYRKASTKASRVTTLGRNEHVIVYSTGGSWAFIATLTGKTGYVKKSSLRKAS